jgi:hypothetical protein
MRLVASFKGMVGLGFGGFTKIVLEVVTHKAEGPP